MKYKHIVFDIDGTLIDTEYAVHFDGIQNVLQELKDKSYRLGIITSKSREEYSNDFLPFGLSDYFDTVVCADDTGKHKPNPEPMLRYLEITQTKRTDVLYIGDSTYDMQCALGAGVECGLALWGRKSINHIKASYYFNEPYDIINFLNKNENEFLDKPWLSWAMELQFIAQAGLTYCTDEFDKERFQRIREISVEIVSLKTGISKELVKSIFCNETGFQTPKLDTRAAIFQNEKILLVKENSGEWALPGGWVDVNQSIKTNTIKEVKEEAGLDVIPLKLIALQDRNKRNFPTYAYGICKVFVLCESMGGIFVDNIETKGSDYFSLDNLPPLAEEKNNIDQIKMCFNAYRDENWIPLFD